MVNVTASSQTTGLTRFVVKLTNGDVLRDRRGRVRSFDTRQQAEAARDRAKAGFLTVPGLSLEGSQVMIRASAGV